MRVSVIIPTRHGDAMPALACAESLEQQLENGDELYVSIDGVDRSGKAVPELDKWGCSGRGKVVVGPQAGPGATRNRAIAQSKGDLILFLNDDVIASPDLVQIHRDAHARRGQAGDSDVIMLGDAPWAVAPDDRVIDRLIRETSWVFFYDQMNNNDPEHDWGFRHAWTLNLSVPRTICEQFDPRLAQPMFDDLEWAFRVYQNHHAKVLYLPAAKVTHHHRYQPRQLLRREILLGHQAAHLFTVNPEAAASIFNDLYSSRKLIRTLLENTEIEKIVGDFARFKQLSTRPSTVSTSAELGELYSGCTSWRTYCRLLGASGYYKQLNAQVAMSQGEKLLLKS